MKLPSILFTLAALLFLIQPALAWESSQQAMVELQDEWAVIQYKTAEEKRFEQFEVLLEKADRACEAYPKDANVLIWRGIIQSTAAGATGGLGALSLVKDSRKSLEKALDIDPDALAGSALTSLGALYYKVPSWPIAFGSSKKARSYLEQALTIDPRGLDSNFFYAEFLFEEGEYEQAKAALETAAQATPRPGRKVADEGRQQEIAELRLRILEKISS